VDKNAFVAILRGFCFW